MQNLRRNDDVRLGPGMTRASRTSWIPPGRCSDRGIDQHRAAPRTYPARGRSRGTVPGLPGAAARSAGPDDGCAHDAVLRPALVGAEDLSSAHETVLARERAEFDKFLVLDYEPWQTLLKRRDAKAYADAEEEARRLLETTFEQRLREEMGKFSLNPADEGLLEDARRDLGPGRHARDPLSGAQAADGHSPEPV